jgi:hypothetical protein
MNVEQTLQERGANYGSFLENATVTQNIKRAMSSGRNWQAITADKQEAMEMIAAKLGRILNGNPEGRSQTSEPNEKALQAANALPPTGRGGASSFGERND